MEVLEQLLNNYFLELLTPSTLLETEGTFETCLETALVRALSFKLGLS